jgi:hypothetical protein
MVSEIEIEMQTTYHLFETLLDPTLSIGFFRDDMRFEFAVLDDNERLGEQLACLSGRKTKEGNNFFDSCIADGLIIGRRHEKINHRMSEKMGKDRNKPRCGRSLDIQRHIIIQCARGVGNIK